MIARLQTQQQNAVLFQSFVIAFCAANNQATPPALNLLTLPKASVFHEGSIKENNSNRNIDVNIDSGGLGSNHPVSPNLNGINGA